MSKRSIVHIEIPAQSRRAGAEFYSKLFGWDAEHMDAPVPYSTLTTGNVGVGMPDMDNQQYKPGDTVIYIETDDVAADLKRIEALGGKRLSDPMTVGEYGEMAFFADPSGNRLALWKAFMPAG